MQGIGRHLYDHLGTYYRLNYYYLGTYYLLKNTVNMRIAVAREGWQGGVQRRFAELDVERGLSAIVWLMRIM
jgi:hypothetical protein